MQGGCCNDYWIKNLHNLIKNINSNIFRISVRVFLLDSWDNMASGSPNDDTA